MAQDTAVILPRDCTCRVSGPEPEDTKFDEACPLHGKDGTMACQVPPPGWFCTRKPRHDGPCAAVPMPGYTHRMPDPDPLEIRIRTRMRQSVWECPGFMTSEEVLALVGRVLEEFEVDRA